MLNVLALPDARDWFALPARRPRLPDRPRGRRARPADRVQPDARLRRRSSPRSPAWSPRAAAVVRASWAPGSRQVDPGFGRPERRLRCALVRRRRQSAARLPRRAARAAWTRACRRSRPQGAAIALLDYLAAVGAARRARRRDAPLPRELRPAADARPCRSPPSRPARSVPDPGRQRALDRLGAVQLPVQPDASSRRPRCPAA